MNLSSVASKVRKPVGIGATVLLLAGAGGLTYNLTEPHSVNATADRADSTSPLGSILPSSGVSLPTVSVPSVSVPGVPVTTPVVTVPTTLPTSVSVPSVSTPAVTVPPVTTPAVAVPVAPSDDALGYVNIVPTSASKAPGPLPTAHLALSETAGVLTAVGAGTNFDPNGQYLSVLYGYGSNSTTCTPDGSLDFGQMLLGAWLPNGSSDRTFVVLAPKLASGPSGVSLSQVKYVSIRETSTMKVASTAQQLGQTFLLAACGTIQP